jgi:DNA modification methylase
MTELNHMPKHNLTNKLNDLSPKEWLKFQKSWFIHNPPPRQKKVLRHPAKFPETLVMDFITFFTKNTQVVFDPMAGTGSTLVAALRCGRRAYGIELNPTYAEIARQVITDEIQSLGLPATTHLWQLITGDAACVKEIAAQHQIPPVDYVITSPPYWDMLRVHGAATQKSRRNSAELDVTYSDDPSDLGNIRDYAEFIDRLTNIYNDLQSILKPGAYMTIIVKNIKKGGKLYPLAWDLAKKLGERYVLKDEKIWCQDNQGLSPYGLGNAWVSNTFHHYCLQFRNE